MLAMVRRRVMLGSGERGTMARYMILNTHEPEQCEPMEEDVDKLPPRIKGKDFYCTCPGGEHAYYMFIEGDTAEEIMSLLPPSLKLGRTRAVRVDVWQL
jgi:hypothetical protein